MKIAIIGDVHGYISKYIGIINAVKADMTIQVGDMGVGFKDINLPELDKKHRFFVGNHDNRQVANEHPNCLGDYGPLPENDKVFFVSGAHTPYFDRVRRTEGVDWWNDEELSYSQLMRCVDLYRECKPDVLLCHDCPQFIRENHFGLRERTLTSQALEEMIGEHPPKLVVFGHHHASVEFPDGPNHKFVCVDELKTYMIDTDDIGSSHFFRY